MGRSHAYNFLSVFGSLCWPNLRPFQKQKPDNRSLPCVFMGYSLDHMGYLWLHISLGRIDISRDVTFNEDIFLLQTQSIPQTEPSLFLWPTFIGPSISTPSSPFCFMPTNPIIHSVSPPNPNSLPSSLDITSRVSHSSPLT